MQQRILMTAQFLTGVCFAGPLLLVGCSDVPESGPTVTVSGKVTVDSKAFSAASIRFTSPDSGASFPVDLNDDGTYSVEIVDADVGEAYRVSFGPSLNPPAKQELDGAGLPKPNPPPPIPARYLDETSSGLTAKISDESSQTFNFDLQSQ